VELQATFTPESLVGFVKIYSGAGLDLARKKYRVRVAGFAIIVGLAQAQYICGCLRSETDRGGYAARPVLDRFERFLNWDAAVLNWAVKMVRSNESHAVDRRLQAAVFTACRKKHRERIKKR
jgi:hypothetical protein